MRGSKVVVLLMAIVVYTRPCIMGVETGDMNSGAFVQEGNSAKKERDFFFRIEGGAK